MSVSLRAALAAEPLLSPKVFFLLRGKEVQVVFKELTQAQKDTLRYQAITEVESWRQQAEKAGVSWRDVKNELDELRANRWELLMLNAAMRDPEDPTKPVCTVPELEAVLDTATQKYLAAKYCEFEEGLSPDNFTEDDINEFITDIKKNNLTPYQLWQRYGTSILWASVLILVHQPEMSQIERFSLSSLQDAQQ